MTIKDSLGGAGSVLALIFTLVGIVSLINRELLDAAIWLSLGVGMAVSITKTPEEWYARPIWQRAISIGLTILALTLLAIRIGIDIMK
jgi:hypothetical protein